MVFSPIGRAGPFGGGTGGGAVGSDIITASQGTLGRTLSEHLGESINPNNYATNDDAAIIAAITALNTDGTDHKRIWLPPGRFVLDNTTLASIVGHNWSIIGSGMGATELLLPATSSGRFFTIGMPGTSPTTNISTRWMIANLTLNLDATATPTQHAIELLRATHGLIMNVRLLNVGGFLKIGDAANFTSSQLVTVANVFASTKPSSNLDAILMQRGITCRFAHVQVQAAEAGTGAGLRVQAYEHCDGLYASDCDFWSAGSGGAGTTPGYDYGVVLDASLADIVNQDYNRVCVDNSRVTAFKILNSATDEHVRHIKIRSLRAETYSGAGIDITNNANAVNGDFVGIEVQGGMITTKVPSTGTVVPAVAIRATEVTPGYTTSLRVSGTLLMDSGADPAKAALIQMGVSNFSVEGCHSAPSSLGTGTDANQNHNYFIQTTADVDNFVVANNRGGAELIAFMNHFAYATASPKRVVKGNTGSVNANPEIQLIRSGSVGTGTEVVITGFGSGWSRLLLRCSDISHGDAASQTFTVNVSADGGTSWQTADMTIAPSVAAAATMVARVLIEPANETGIKTLTAQGGTTASTSAKTGYSVDTTSIGPINAIRVKPSAGSFDGGTYRLYAYV